MRSLVIPICQAPTTDGDSSGGGHHVSRLVQRQAVLIGVAISPQEQEWVPARITDISQHGCRLVTRGNIMAAGMTVQVMLPGFAARDAHIVWADGTMAGSVFDQPLPVAILDHIVRMSDPAARG